MPGRPKSPHPYTKDRRRTRRRRTILFTIATACVIGAAGVTYYAFQRPLKVAPSPNGSTFTNLADKSQIPADPNRSNILLIGSDTRPGQVGGNTDVLILCSIDRAHNRIELLSIPRDTKVTFPDGDQGKINEALSLGGPALTERMVSDLLGVHIDDYALTHFGGLVQIIDTLGGIRVDVPERMYYRTGDKQYGVINLQPGVQTLNGAQALGFVRFRHDRLGDIGRTERQQEFLKALSQKLMEPTNIIRLPQLIREFWGTIDTDMSLGQVIDLAAHAKEYKHYSLVSETLPGSFHNPDPTVAQDASYWIVNPTEARYATKHLLEYGTHVKDPVQDPSVTEHWMPADGMGANARIRTTSTGDAANGNRTVTSTPAGDSSTVNPDTSTPPVPDAVKMVVSGHINVRSGPSKDYAIMGTAAPGETLWKLGETGGWDKVQLSNGSVGYVASSLLSPAQ
ncbi:MAG: LCP family protein [Alicyclobacillus macrosporangiidus]|uniref:LCP family protein n=1 Tax=Alicyclobacillus macrosporangiidus TaxID=392015 RepID=UPI0026F06ADA|nr:LCP family protein [Alicyclobacillus macrosporangiidus]MCL6597863.1 LCP family protein [Alicyclobacillus macrosporangiidus]